ncbi:MULTISPECIES: UTRA domain-containing protein [Streptomyces]|uniref:UTRA domain-containing protein n=1 Tax=Streptomyces TaxID=1883 RepID=UPI001E42A990|nr:MULTISPECIES: UTRA domain-containing protein [Streptomyces]UFQ15990.1 UTRA domain-containing protein [Streptomyces huasconensis]WCL85593.1 UTRA domain-containing protein [Streptomyces sp. JCM 35825]
MSDSTWVSTSMPYLTPREKGQPDAWGEEAASQGGKGGRRIVYAGEGLTPEEVAARMPTVDEREALRLGGDEPLLRLNRVTLDGDDRPIQTDPMVMPAHRQRLHYGIRIG